MPGWELAARAGYTHQPAQIPDSAFNPGIPSADVHILSTGLGFLCHAHGSLFGLYCGRLRVGSLKVAGVGLDVSYQTSLYEERTVSGNSGIRAGVNGHYRSTLHTGGLSLRAHF